MKLKNILLKSIYVLGFSIIGWFILAFIIAPIVSSIYEVLFSGGKFSFSTIEKLLASKKIMNSLLNSFVMAFWTVITVSIVGIFQILVTEYFDIKLSRILDMIYLTPLIYGGISLVTGYKYVYSSNGVITKFLTNIFPNLNNDWFTGFVGILFVHTFSMTMYHILFVKTSFKKIDYSTIEASRSLGCSSIKSFFKVGLPVVKPAIFSATLLVFLAGISSLAAPVGLGNGKFDMINSMILNLNSIGSKDLAVVLAIILAIACVILLVIFKYIEKKSNYLSVSKVPTKIRKVKIKNSILNFLVHGLAYFLGLIYMLPISLIIIFSLSDVTNIVKQQLPTTLTLQNYIRVFSESSIFKPILTSMLIACVTIIILLIICVVASIAIHKKNNFGTKILEYVLLIPWILPTILIAVGMVTIYSTPNILAFKIVLLGSFWILPIAYVVERIPSTMRLIRASLYNINKSHEEASRSLGAGVIYTFFKVVVPVILPTIISVAAITFNGLLAEYNIAAILYNVKNMPLGIVLSPQQTSDPNIIGNKLVYIVILMALSTITLIFTKKHRDNIKF